MKNKQAACRKSEREREREKARSVMYDQTRRVRDSKSPKSQQDNASAMSKSSNLLRSPGYAEPANRKTLSQVQRQLKTIVGNRFGDLVNFWTRYPNFENFETEISNLNIK